MMEDLENLFPTSVYYVVLVDLEILPMVLAEIAAFLSVHGQAQTGIAVNWSSSQQVLVYTGFQAVVGTPSEHTPEP